MKTQYQLVLPTMGESIAEATIIKWVKKPGDWIDSDESVLEIATDKVDSEVPSPVAGKLIKQLFKENEIVQVGAVIALIEIEQDHPTDVLTFNPESLQEVAVERDPSFKALNVQLTTLGNQYNEVLKNTTAPKTAPRFYSPLVKNIAAGEGISSEELDRIQGTGAEGRVTKQDLLNFIQQRALNPQNSTAPEGKAIRVDAERKEEMSWDSASASTSLSGHDEVIEMDRMRKMIAAHMVMSKQTAPHVTSFVEVDVTNIVRWRTRVKASFEKREGQNITFTPIFIEAVSKAIKDFPMINVVVKGTQIIKKRDINIGMATALPSGNLIVPVLKNADQFNLVGLTKAVNDMADRARRSKLKPEEIQGGTFTLSNIGSFGNVMGTPIINQPQVAILAVGVIKKKPAVIETAEGDVIAIRHMMFLSLSYDHRVVDGALGGSFLRKVADYMEAWDVDREI